MTKTITTIVASLLLFARTASADPVVLDISFGTLDDAFETAFGIFADPSPFLEDDILLDPFSAFDGGSSLAPIAFDVGNSAPIGDFTGFAPLNSFFFVDTFTNYSFEWDLGPGSYAFVLLDAALFSDYGLGGGAFNLAVNGASVGGGDGAFDLPNPFFFESIARIDFTIEDMPPVGVPEPGTLGLLGLGLFGLAWTRRRRR